MGHPAHLQGKDPTTHRRLARECALHVKEVGERETTAPVLAEELAYSRRERVGSELIHGKAFLQTGEMVVAVLIVRASDATREAKVVLVVKRR